VMSSEKKMIIKHETSDSTGGAPQETQSKRVVLMVALPDASLVDDLKKELATIPGLPTPQLTDATWFTENGLPDLTQPGINISLNFDDHQGGSKQHVFNFPDSATEQQIETEINNWLVQNEPDCKFTVKVTLSGDEKNRKVEVSIEGTSAKTSAPAPSAGPATP